MSQSVFLEQFKIKTIFSLPEIFGLNIDLTNSSVFAFSALVFSVVVLLFGVSSTLLVPKRAQMFAEFIYGFINKTLCASAGKESKSFISLVISIFFFLSVCNLLGMVPGAFTVTSHIAVNFALSAFLILLISAYGLKRNGVSFLRVFLPSGVPLFIAPFISIVEIIAYLFRSASLSLRLTANMVAGHVMIKVIAALAEQCGLHIVSVFPIILLAVLVGFEVFVAVLQGYIFALLSSVYIGDAFKKH